MKTLILVAVIVQTVVAVTLTSPAIAQFSITTILNPNAAVAKLGQVVLVHVAVTCDPIGEVLEAFVTVQQDIFGMGSLGNVNCDGTSHGYLAKVQALDGVFHSGEAHASAFVLICDETTGQCSQGQDTGTILVRGPP